MLENINTFLNHLRSVKPAAAKGTYIRSITDLGHHEPGHPGRGVTDSRPPPATEHRTRTMSKYVKELMMDQLRSDLDGSRSLLILDLKGLDAIAEYQLRRDLRKKSIKVRALKNTLARRVFTDMGMDGLSKYLEGPSVAVWGGDGVAELAKEISTQVKTLKKPEIKGGAVDGVVIGPEQVEDITKLPSREALIGRVVSLALAPRSGSSRWPTRRPRGLHEPAEDPVRGAPRRRAEAGADAAGGSEPEPPPQLETPQRTSARGGGAVATSGSFG